MLLFSIMQDELQKDISQLLGHFNRIMHKFMQLFKSLEEKQVAELMPPAPPPDHSKMLPVSESINNELVRG